MCLLHYFSTVVLPRPAPNSPAYSQLSAHCSGRGIPLPRWTPRTLPWSCSLLWSPASRTFPLGQIWHQSWAALPGLHSRVILLINKPERLPFSQGLSVGVSTGPGTSVHPVPTHLSSWGLSDPSSACRLLPGPWRAEGPVTSAQHYAGPARHEAQRRESACCGPSCVTPGRVVAELAADGTCAGSSLLHRRPVPPAVESPGTRV